MPLALSAACTASLYAVSDVGAHRSLFMPAGIART